MIKAKAFITKPIKGEHSSPEAIFNGGFWKSGSDSGERGIELTFERETTIKSFRFKIPGKKYNAHYQFSKKSKF